MNRLATIAFTLAATAAAFTTTLDTAEANRGDRTYRVTVTNDTYGQYFTPANFAAHGRDRLFGYGQLASDGIQGVAENGDWEGLEAEFNEAGLDTGIAFGENGVIAPGESATFEVTTNLRRFSVVSMIICTNDGFAGINSRRLPARMGEVTNDVLRSYDAGTEINTELHEDIVPAPFCGGGGAGTGMTNPDLAEDGVIRGHRGITGNGDLDDNFDFGRFIGEVTIERIR